MTQDEIQKHIDAFKALPQEEQDRLMEEQRKATAESVKGYERGPRYAVALMPKEFVPKAMLDQLVLKARGGPHPFHTTPEVLRWIADRCVSVYHESPNADFVQLLRERADMLQEALTGARSHQISPAPVQDDPRMTALVAEVAVLRGQRMAPAREAELLAANNAYLARARAAEAALRQDPSVERCAWIAQQLLIELGVQGITVDPIRDDTGSSLPHLVYMLQELAEKKVGSGTKSCRWLGWVQACLMQKGLISLEESKEVNLQSRDKVTELYPLTYQQRVFTMILHSCQDDPTDVVERGDRFFEEVCELMQASKWTKERLFELVEYVYGREVGEPMQEMGGAMVTLAGFATFLGLDAAACGERELERCWKPETIEKIRAKRRTRVKGSPLPGTVSQ